MNETIDRISSLPSDVLTHILSFMSTKEAVQTCILAKRWRNIWASVPVLCFYLDEFLKMNVGQEDDDNSYSGDDYNERKISEEGFERFVDGALENRGPSHVDRVIYSWRYEFEAYAPFTKYHPSMNFLDRVALLMPRVIIAHIDIPDYFLVPDSVFSCASLQKLIMHLNSDGCRTSLDPNLINLPSLKTLELKCVEIKDNFVRNLFLGCPTLESIMLDFCDLHVPVISSSMLKMLTLYDCMLCQPLRISCPALVSLLIHDKIYEEGSISLQNMTSLVNADIKFLQRDDICPLPPLNLLSGLSNARSLKLYILSPELKKQLDKDIPNCKTFNNLKSLEIGEWDMLSNFDLVACFLKISPKLQELSLQLINSHGDAHEAPIQDAVRDILFQIEYLETLKIYGNSEVAAKMVKILRRCIKTVGNISYYC